MYGPRYWQPQFAAVQPPAAAPDDVEEPIELPGRPTSWPLVEEECRRRYIEDGERHPGKRGERPAQWARVLLAWLRETHPSAPPLSSKTAQNNLSKLLRELSRNSS